MFISFKKAILHRPVFQNEKQNSWKCRNLIGCWLNFFSAAVLWLVVKLLRLVCCATDYVEWRWPLPFLRAVTLETSPSGLCTARPATELRQYFSHTNPWTQANGRETRPVIKKQEALRICKSSSSSWPGLWLLTVCFTFATCSRRFWSLLSMHSPPPSLVTHRRTAIKLFAHICKPLSCASHHPVYILPVLRTLRNTLYDPRVKKPKLNPTKFNFKKKSLNMLLWNYLFDYVDVFNFLGSVGLALSFFCFCLLSLWDLCTVVEWWTHMETTGGHHATVSHLECI